MTSQETIKSIVMAGLCTGCGTCVAICPQNAIAMQESPAGHLFAEIDTELCNHCALCYRICPGSHLESTLIDNTIDPFKGKVLAAFCGYATDSTIRLTAQSGGIITALLGYQLHSGRIKKALVTTMPEDGSLRPQAALCSTPSEVYRAGSSKYCPVAVNAALPNSLNGENNIAIVGLSCHLHGIRNVQTYRKDWREQISLTIGLFCDGVLTFKAFDYLIQKGGGEKKAVLSLRYKDKRHGKFPGNVIIQNADNVISEVPGSYRLKCKRLFKPARCYLCFDKVNILSDIAVGDAWGIHGPKEEGLSVVLARTKKGLDTLYAAQKDGILHLEPIDSDVVFRGQRIESRRTVWKAYTEIWQQAHRKAPEFHIPQEYQGGVEETGKMYKTIRKDYEWTSRLASQKTSEDVERAVKKWQQQLFFRTLFSRHGVKEVLLFPVRRLKRAISKFL